MCAAGCSVVCCAIKELISAREEICKLKARTVNSNFMEQDNSGNWKKKKKQLQVP
jgi:hypothetical protein